MPITRMVCKKCGHKYNLPTKTAKKDGFIKCPKCGFESYKTQQEKLKIFENKRIDEIKTSENICEFYPKEKDDPVCACNSDISGKFVCTREYSKSCPYAIERRKQEREIKMNLKIFENKRIDENDFSMDYSCSFCPAFVSMVVQIPKTDLLICKSCLTKMIEMIDISITRSMKK